MNVYINPEAEVLNQISAVVRDDSGKLLGCTKPQNIPKGATEAEINEMKEATLTAARNSDFIERH